jgi:hypothetical protein
MRRFEITRSRLELPRLLNGVELAPEPGNARFDVSTVEIKRITQEIDGENVAEISLGLKSSKTSVPFECCVFLDFPSAKTIAHELLQTIGETPGG